MSNLVRYPSRGPNSFRVEANVPIPSARRGREKKECPFPLLRMQVGESFLIGPCEDEKTINQARTWAQTITKDEMGAVKFITREVTDQARVDANDSGRYWRVWRVEP